MPKTCQRIRVKSCQNVGFAQSTTILRHNMTKPFLVTTHSCFGIFLFKRQAIKTNRPPNVGLKGFWLRMPLSVVGELAHSCYIHIWWDNLSSLRRNKVTQRSFKDMSPGRFQHSFWWFGHFSCLSAPWGGSQMWHGQTKRTCGGGQRVAPVPVVS